LDGQARIAGAHVDIGADEYGSAIPFMLTSRIAGPELLLSVNSEPNRTYIFERSSDLVHWLPFSTNCATNSCFEIPVPPLAAGSSFYRAKAE